MFEKLETYRFIGNQVQLPLLAVPKNMYKTFTK